MVQPALDFSPGGTTNKDGNELKVRIQQSSTGAKVREPDILYSPEHDSRAGWCKTPGVEMEKW